MNIEFSEKDIAFIRILIRKEISHFWYSASEKLLHKVDEDDRKVALGELK